MSDKKVEDLKEEKKSKSIKQTLKRYQILDKLLCDKSGYNMNSLVNEVNKRLPDEEKVVRRTIEKDIKLFQEIFNVKIIKDASQRRRYPDVINSVFKEIYVNDKIPKLEELRKNLSYYGGGAFDTSKRLIDDLGISTSEKKYIIFDYNEGLVNKEMLGDLLLKIKQKKTISLRYKPFKEEEQEKIVFPYLLKQYNNRWFLFAGNAENNTDYKIINFALDRIVLGSVKTNTEIPYKPCKIDLKARFEKIVGVTYLEDEEELEILLWAKKYAFNYIRTKPIHSTQKEVEAKDYKEEYKNLADDGVFFTIKCIPNRELYNLLSSFGDELIVLKPEKVREKMHERVKKMEENYKIT